MNHVTKILLRIITKRKRNNITPEIAEEQFGFINDKSTANAIYIIRTLIEREIEVKVDLFLCLIDYTKAFDSIRHNEVINMLEELHVDGKDLSINKYMYWQQTAAVRVDNIIGTSSSSYALPIGAGGHSSPHFPIPGGRYQFSCSLPPHPFGQAVQYLFLVVFHCLILHIFFLL
jgi:hypothetical protein